MGKKLQNEKPCGHAETHILEALAWNVCRKKHPDRAEAVEEFLALTTPNWLDPEGHGVAGNIQAKGYG